MSRTRQIAEMTATLVVAGALLGSSAALAARRSATMLNYEAVAASDVQAPDAAAAGNGPSLPGGPPQTPEAVAQPGMVVNGEALQAPAMPEQAGEAGGQDAPEVQDNGGRRRHHIAPYIEARQVLDAELSPQHNTFTYSVLAAGVDGTVEGRNTQASVSLRYERLIGEGSGAGSANAVSGVARASYGVVPGLLTLDAAGYASRTNVLSNGAALPGISDNHDTLTQIYSVAGGPTLSTYVGDVKLNGQYHIGYNHVGTPGGFFPANGTTGVVGANNGARADIFDHSTVQDAKLRAALRPGEVLPVGIAVEGGYYREDVSDLAQRTIDRHVRGEVTIPVASDLALVGGIGYEAVKVSSRNAVLDAQGNPVYDANGRLQTDFAGPRYIAFDTSGLIWDAGVLWHPGPRTSLEAHVGRRYGDIGAYGLFSWHPTSRAALNVAVYNNLAGFGGQLDGSLLNLSTQFQPVRNALTGNITPCVNSTQGGACLNGALGSVRSTVFHSRGITGSYNLDFGRIQAGISAGYDRRTYIAAAGTILAAQNGEVDQNYFVTGYLTYEIDQRSSLAGTLNAYWFRTGLALDGDLNAVGATAVYQRRISRHLSASAALGVDSINRQALEDIWSATGSLAVRYTF